MKRTFSKEFKQKACELVLKEGIKHAVVAENWESIFFKKIEKNY